MSCATSGGPGGTYMIVPKVQVVIDRNKGAAAQPGILKAFVEMESGDGAVRGVNLLAGRQITVVDTAKDAVRDALFGKVGRISWKTCSD
jgi:hypothetical protein